MLDLRVLRDNFQTIANALKKRGKETGIEEVLSLDEKKRDLLQKVEELKARRNKVSKEIPVMRKNGEDVQEIMAEMKEVGLKIKEYDDELREVDDQLHTRLMSIPNRPDSSVPAGTDDSDNQFVRDYLKPTEFDFEPKPHWELGDNLGWFDPEMAARVTGTRFMFYRGMGARLERIVMNFMLNTHSERNGYTEVIPPYIANEKSMTGTGQLPKFAEDMYKLEGLDYYLIPTAEVPVTNMYREQILDASELPMRFCAGTPCFRAEAGSAGRDTRGLIRQHQFNKVELVKLSHPDNSYDELELLLKDAESILRLLEIPYRVVLLCGGDLGFSSAKTYDIEVWMPSYGRYVEISSCSNFEDFQARRANIRFRDEDGKPKFVHTLNGSGLAVGRTVAAIVENYQQQDGRIKTPDVLIPYIGRDYLE
ncbi:serine--tRNA ligase [Christensenellaceae bacterium OttesenSCG-928-K19]|nr:serine--tRNA ligase [Christensenellaceae bacterium OttesenSCG-928-K19]